MPLLAAFTNAGTINPVEGWFDTDVLNYGTNLPANTITLTADQWAARTTGHWAVQVTGTVETLVTYTPPPPPPPSAAPIIAASAQSLALSNAKSLAASGDTAGALAAALALIEGLMP